VKQHWKTLLGAAVGAAGGGLYAHYVGCRTGTCLITSNAWLAAAFFGFMGAAVGLPIPEKTEARDRSPDAPP
jgi:hypothetical protein